MEKKTLGKKKESPSLTDIVFSWSLQDVLNSNLYKGQVNKIADTFQSTDEYKNAFVLPLIEETHADLCSSLINMRNPPAREAMSVKMLKRFKSSKTWLYKMELKNARNEVDYKPQSGDLIALTAKRPRNIHDLRRHGQAYLVAYVRGNIDEDPDLLKILTSGPIMSEEHERELLFAVYLVNLTTNNRIYAALDTKNKVGNMKVISQVLQKTPNGENCEACYLRVNQSEQFSEIRSLLQSYNLNDSQESAILSGICLRECRHRSSVKLIWGPPGTGKTKTTSLLLFCLLKMKCRTLTCAPTNIAVLEVTKRLLNLVVDSLEYDTYGFGDLVLFGDKERMKIIDHDDLAVADVFLDHRIEILMECFSPSFGYVHTLTTMISLLGGSFEENEKEKGIEEREGGFDEVDQAKSEMEEKRSTYKSLKHTWEKVIVQTIKENKNKDNQEKEKLKDERHVESICDDPRSRFMKFVNTFNITYERLRLCLVSLYTHLPTSLVSLQVVKKMIRALGLLKSLKTLLSCSSFSDEGMNQLLKFELQGVATRKDCLYVLKSLQKDFPVPNLTNKDAIKSFCLANARLIFCTAASSVKVLGPVDLVVIDEAAQLKECESAIPLQVSGLRHAILIGDERQLPAMVQSKISGNAEFGRSLFGRLVLLGHKKHLLNVQYRMHPSISLFPNREFYGKQILDAPLVQERSYKKQFLQGNMYGSFSFINVAYGEEDHHGGYSARNMVEVAVVSEILACLYKEVVKIKKKISVGVISPYKAQVHAIGEKIRKTYSSKADGGFSVHVRSVDGFQGSEEDVIIISTVRSNLNGSVGFLSNFQRANVALTRARHCLWIVGNGSTLVHSDSIWKNLVMDARDRGCFFDAEDDDRLAQAMTASLLELGQLDTLLQMDSPVFKKSTWKVCFSDEFLNSMARMKSKWIISKETLFLIQTISNGWRRADNKRRDSMVTDGVSSHQCLERYKVNGAISLIWSIDIVREDSYYIQVVKVWDVVSDTDVPKLAERLDTVFTAYSASKMSKCKEKSTQGILAVPMKWLAELEMMHENEDVHVLSKSLASMTPSSRRFLLNDDFTAPSSSTSLSWTSGFDRRDKGKRGSGSSFDSQSRADESDSWISNKSSVNTEGRRFGGLEREVTNGGPVLTSGRPRLVLQPRTLPMSVVAPVIVPKQKPSNPFGQARPREEVLAEKGQDWKEIDEKLETIKIKETAEKVDKLSFGRGSKVGMGERKKPETGDVDRPDS